MANLIECPACKASVSSAAPTCPKCGHPISQPAQRPVVISHKPQTNWGCAVVILVALGYFIYALAQGGSSANSTASASGPSPAAPALPASECRKILSCIGEKLVANTDLWIACKHAIDAQAKNDSQWDDGILSPPISGYKWETGPHGNVDLIGDRVRFENGFGGWIRMSYICTVDPDANYLVSTHVYQGKLPN